MAQRGEGVLGVKTPPKGPKKKGERKREKVGPKRHFGNMMELRRSMAKNKVRVVYLSCGSKYEYRSMRRQEC